MRLRQRPSERRFYFYVTEDTLDELATEKTATGRTDGQRSVPADAGFPAAARSSGAAELSYLK